MSKIEVSYNEVALLKFDSDKWKNNEEYIDVANEIIDFIKTYEGKLLLIQNTSYYFGDTENHPIIMVQKGDFGGLKGTLDLYIKDIVHDLIPEDE